MFARQGDIDFSVNGCHLFAKYTLLVKARFRHNFGWKCPNRFGNVLTDKKTTKIVIYFIIKFKAKGNQNPNFCGAFFFSEI